MELVQDTFPGKCQGKPLQQGNLSQYGVKEKYQPLYQKLVLTMVEHRGVEPLTSTMRMSRATNCANAPYSIRSRLRLSRTNSIIPHVSGFVNTFFRKKQIFLKVSFQRGLHAGRRLSVASIKSARRLHGESAAPQRYSRRAASFRRARQRPQPYRQPRRYSRQSA